MSALRLAGQIERDVALLFVEQLAGLGAEDAPLSVDLFAADLDDSVATALLIDGLRAVAQRLGRVVISGAPQVLAHGLYRVGALGDAIVLVDPRSELGASS